MDREKVIKGLQDAEISLRGFANHFPPLREMCHEQADACHDAIALLKEQETVVKQWTKEIADNQLAHAPDELDRENWDYKKGIWDGLQIAWNIISEGR